MKTKETPTEDKTMEELENDMKKEHLSFCREYVLKGRNGKQSYLKAYGTDIKEEGAERSASRLLRHVEVKAYIRYLKEELREKYNITLETQLEKTAKIYTLSKDKEEYRTALACIQEESKLSDLYEPEKVESKTTLEIVNYADIK